MNASLLWLDQKGECVYVCMYLMQAWSGFSTANSWLFARHKTLTSGRANVWRYFKRPLECETEGRIKNSYDEENFQDVPSCSQFCAMFRRGWKSLLSLVWILISQLWCTEHLEGVGKWTTAGAEGNPSRFVLFFIMTHRSSLQALPAPGSDRIVNERLSYFIFIHR